MKTNSVVNVFELPKKPVDLSQELNLEGSSICFSDDNEENTLVFDALHYLKEKTLSISDIERIGLALIKYDSIGKEIFCFVAKNSYREFLDSLEDYFGDLAKNPNQGVTHLSILQIAAKHGWVLKKKSKKMYLHFMRDFLAYKYEWRYNAVKQRVEYRKKGGSIYYELDDRVMNSIFLEIIEEGSIQITITELNILLSSKFSQEFEPLRNYFDNLPKWDGRDYISELNNTIMVEPQFVKFWPLYLQKWLIGLVAGIYSDRDVNQSAIIIHGGQGIGKSRWIRTLVPDELIDYYYTGKISSDNKDSKLIAYTNFLINLDELDFPEKKEINSLKSLITQKETKERFPFNRFYSSIKKRSSFIGSVNRKEFLNDPTGNRRFLCVTATDINVDHGIDMRMVYSQAKHLFESGEKFWFTTEECTEITKMNLEFSYSTMEEEKILDKYIPCEASDPEVRFLTTTEINEEILPDHVDTTTRNRLGQALSKHGFIQRSKFINGDSKKRWFVKNKSHYSINLKSMDDLPF
ncbi:MAG: hypothetical protein KF816_02220 [Melioribacteraceae bacterium]|nr:hypothetical protein [Melioribacteraceae bacterium]